MTITRTFKTIQLVFATVTGSGFDPGEVVEINFAGDIVMTTADGCGKYQTTFTINRSVPAGSHPLDANGMGGSWLALHRRPNPIPVPRSVSWNRMS